MTNEQATEPRAPESTAQLSTGKSAADPQFDFDLDNIRERIGHLRGLAEAADLIGSCWTNWDEDKDRCDDFLVAVRELNRQLALRLKSLQEILNGWPEGGASCA